MSDSKQKFILLSIILALFAFSGCDSNNSAINDDNQVTVDDDSADTGNTGNTGDTGNTGNTGNTGDTGNTGNTGDTGDDEEDNEVPDWDESDATWIYLEGDSIRVEGSGASANGTVATITDDGVFYVTGTLNDGQVLVDTASEERVNVVFDTAVITCSTNSPFAVMNAKDVTIYLNDNTENSLTDAYNYTFTDGADEPNAALYSKSDLVISGNGSLLVNGNYNDGIASKDDLKIKGGTIMVNAADDGIRGKDSVEIKGGTITINSLGDGLKSDNEEDETRGYILMEDGSVTVASGTDGMDAFTNVTIAGGSINIKSGNGSNSMPNDSISTKGIKGSSGVNITGGIITVDSSDDCIHSGGDIVIDGGTFTLSTGDDGVHSDTNLTVNGGDITITKSYEGLEALYITINNGNIHIVSSDDGLNCAGGDGSSGWNPGGPGDPGVSGDYLLSINGGYVYMNAGGDGLDSNGDFEMSGGIVLVDGPTNDGNGAIDTGDGQDNYFQITGGFLIAAGSSGMAEGADTNSTQNSVKYNFNSLSGKTLFHVESSNGDEIFTYAPSKQYASVVFSMPALNTGTGYVVYTGGSHSGTPTDGLYEGGSYTPGSQSTTFTISSVVTEIGGGSHFPPQ